MNIRNENRPGYKKTKVGWIPEEWEVKKLSEVCRYPVSGFSANNTDNSINPHSKFKGVLKLSCISDGKLNPLENKEVLPEDIEKLIAPVKRNTIIISRSNTAELVGAVCFVREDIPNLFLSDLLWSISPKNENSIDMEWLATLLQLKRFRQEIMSRSHGTSGSMKKLTKDEFLGITIPMSPLPEQRRIATILSVWDRAIDQVRALIESKKKLKKGLMQQLLTGRMRFPEFGKPAKQGALPEGWKHAKLGECFDERDENDIQLPLLSITAERGVIPRDEVERKDTSNADKGKYKRIVPGDIGYNTMRMWQGVSALSSLEGIVSPAYTVCTPRKGINSHYFSHLFKQPKTINLFHRYSQGLVDDTLNLKYHHFSMVKVDYPASEKEQKKIAALLKVCDQEMVVLEKKIAAMQAHKKGLMQKLLTGEVRVHLAKNK